MLRIPLKGGASMLRYYDSFHAALKDAFPELAFNFLGTFLFSELPCLLMPFFCVDTPSFEYFTDPKVCRQAFDEVAHSQGLNPLNPETWYSWNFADLVSKVPNGRSIKQFNGGLRKALRIAYPELIFDKWTQGISISFSLS